jgi:hypothetical protein
MRVQHIPSFGHRAARALAAVTVLVATAGCYTYTPIEAGELQPGDGLRARVSAAAGERIAPLLGTTSARLLSGTLIGDARDTLIVEVPTVVRVELGSTAQTLHQRVSIARGEILELEARKVDRFRTGALFGGAAALGGMLLVKSLRGDPASERLPGGPETEALSPLYQIVR